MAKASNFTFLNLGQVVRFAGHNPSREADGVIDNESWGKPHETLPPLFLDGFDPSKGTISTHSLASVENVPDVNEDTALQSRKDRQATYATMDTDKGLSFEVPIRFATYILSQLDDKPKNIAVASGHVKVSVTYHDVAAVLKDYQNIKPTHWAFAGQRRVDSLPWIVALCRALHLQYDDNGLLIVNEYGDPVLADEPTKQTDIKFVCRVVPFVSLENTYDMVLQENNRDGQQQPSEPMRFYRVCQLVKKRPLASMSDVFSHIGVGATSLGTRQKYHSFALLNYYVPGLDLDKRVLPSAIEKNDVDDKGMIVYRPNGPIKLQSLSPYIDAVHLANIGSTDRKNANVKYSAAVMAAMSHDKTTPLVDRIAEAATCIEHDKRTDFKTYVSTRKATVEECEEWIESKYTARGAAASKSLSNADLLKIKDSPNCPAYLKEFITLSIQGDIEAITDKFLHN